MHLRRVITAVLFLLASVSLMPIDIYRGLLIRITYDDASGYPTKQAFYNAFGDLIGDAPTASWIGYDFNDQIYTASAIRFNPAESVSVGYQYGKHGDVMFDKGLVSFTDKLFMGDLDLRIDIVPNGASISRKIAYSPYVLQNNLLDGIFLNLGNKKALELEVAWSHLRPTLRETSPFVYPDTFQGYFGEEAEYLFAGMVDLNFLKEIKTELLTINSLRLSWSAMVHRDSLAHGAAFLGSAPLGDGAVLTTNYSVTNVQFAIAPFRSLDGSNYAAFYGYTVEFEGTNFTLSLSAASIVPTSGTYLTNDSRGTPYLRIDEGNKYTFTIQIPRIPAKKVKINFWLANSFYVQQYFYSGQQYDSYRQQQLHTPSDVVVSSVKHNIRDFSNYKQYAFYLGITTANHNFGLEADMVFAGFSVKGGVYPNVSLLQAPIQDADYNPTLSMAWYAEV
ncbi:MAG: hypothetical protein AABZ39_12750, partial [Spirochaetota bacterium]